MARDAKALVAFRTAGGWEPPTTSPSGVVKPGKIGDATYTKEEALKYLIGQAARADAKFAKSDQKRRGPETAAARDSCLAVAYRIANGEGSPEKMLDLDAERDKEFEALLSPDGKSTLDEEGLLADLLKMEPPDDKPKV